ncbi:MAG TPA: hypothetical protein VIK33_10450 [Anaerolineae bacterium]
MLNRRLSSFRSLVVLLTLMSLLAAACAPASQPTAQSGFVSQIAQGLASMQDWVKRAVTASQSSGAPSSDQPGLWSNLVRAIQSAVASAKLMKANAQSAATPSTPETDWVSRIVQMIRSMLRDLSRIRGMPPRLEERLGR